MLQRIGGFLCQVHRPRIVRQRADRFRQSQLPRAVRRLACVTSAQFGDSRYGVEVGAAPVGEIEFQTQLLNFRPLQRRFVAHADVEPLLLAQHVCLEPLVDFLMNGNKIPKIQCLQKRHPRLAQLFGHDAKEILLRDNDLQCPAAERRVTRSKTGCRLSTS